MKLKKFNDFEFLKESKSCPDCIKKFIVDEKDLIIDSIKNRTDLLNLSIFIFFIIPLLAHPDKPI